MTKGPLFIDQSKGTGAIKIEKNRVTCIPLAEGCHEGTRQVTLSTVDKGPQVPRLIGQRLAEEWVDGDHYSSAPSHHSERHHRRHWVKYQTELWFHWSCHCCMLVVLSQYESVFYNIRLRRDCYVYINSDWLLNTCVLRSKEISRQQYFASGAGVLCFGRIARLCPHNLLKGLTPLRREKNDRRGPFHGKSFYFLEKGRNWLSRDEKDSKRTILYGICLSKLYSSVVMITMDET